MNSHPTLTSTGAMSNDLQVPVLTLELGRDLHLVYLRELSIVADVKEYCPVIIITCYVANDFLILCNQF